MTERREHARRRTLLEGRLEIEKLNGWMLDCTVRNVSEGGVRLALPAHVVVPQTVSLTISNGPRRPATLVWYREGQAGFALDDRRFAPSPVPANDSGAPQSDAARLAIRVCAIPATGRSGPRATQV